VLRARAERIGPRVELVGAVSPDEVAARLRRADVFALPSHREGLPLALLEAMAAELAVVVTPVGEMAAVVEDGACGVVVPASDAPRLASVLRALAADRSRVRALGTAARRRVASAYAADAGIARLRALWSELAPR
jgi:glycosyltransferase involved in cell wall biosynthesis